MNSRLIIAAADISSSTVLAKRFRGKTAKEIYRCGKGVILSGSILKPVAFAVTAIPGKLTKGVIYSAVGESVIGYASGIGFVRFLYRAAQPAKLKATARLIYNIGCLPMTLYSKGVGGAYDLLGLSKLEELWFGRPVYIFDDNRLWIERNFTLKDVFKAVDDNS